MAIPKNICFFVIFYFFLAPPLSAAENKGVYKYIREDGEVIYTTTPQNKGDLPEQLPEIKKENLTSKVENLKQNTPRTCEDHGGINCQAGAGVEKNVICHDGWTQAEIPYRLACVNVVLKIINTSLVGQDGQIMDYDKKKNILDEIKLKRATAVQFTVRNNNTVKAKDVLLALQISRNEKITALGSNYIEPYAVEDYIFPIAEFLKQPKLKYFNTGLIKLECSNCM
ncbi:MAG: hypothetical protein LBE20_01515 [Deltaproteobacteria bacterium]|jgi:hypothetical protein|nr:hypothetical protein [Deltaproteobacteria bacterium]